MKSLKNLAARSEILSLAWLATGMASIASILLYL